MKTTITVCDKCLQASCWQGMFMCQEAEGAGIVEKTREELEALKLEHPSWWEDPKPATQPTLTPKGREEGI